MKFEANFAWGQDIAREQAETWAQELASVLPDGAEFTLKTVPLVLDVQEVTEQHAGNQITIRGYFDHIAKGDTKKAKAQAATIVKSAHLTGQLEHVFESGAHPAQRTLIIDGKAYDVPAYSLVELGEW